MPMTKAEKARMEELETALALCWPAYPAPAPMTLEEIKAALVDIPSRSTVPGYAVRKVAIGWFYNAYSSDVTRGWSTGYVHNPHADTGENGSQNMGRMYASREAAAMTMRLEMSRNFARKLAAVDRIISGNSTINEEETR